MTSKDIIKQLRIIFPDAKCELDYHNNFELLIAVLLSAQTTDQKVNKVTKKLFAKYPDAKSMKEAGMDEVIEIIKPLGLANNKSKNIITLSKTLWQDYQGVVPDKYEQLVQLAGVGRKTANVVLLEAFRIPTIPVDTHVERVSKRLGLVDKDAGVKQVEERLMELLSKSYWIEAHQLLIHFGRYLCKAIKPECDKCPFTKICKIKAL